MDARGTRTPINPERIARLATLGLNEQQARAYLALIDVATSTVNDLSKTSRVPRAKLYEVMEALNRKGLVDVIPETPLRYRANPLSALYDNRVEELRSEEAELKRTIGELMVHFVQGPKDGRGDPERDFVHVLHGRTHFPVVTRQLISRATSSILLVGDKLLLARLRIYEDLPQALASLGAKIPVRIVVPDNVVEEIDGRRLRLDELESNVHRAPLTLGDACVLVRDGVESMVVHFIPNDLHASRGSDRVEVGHDPEIASLWLQLGMSLWDASPPWKSKRGA